MQYTSDTNISWLDGALVVTVGKIGPSLGNAMVGFENTTPTTRATAFLGIFTTWYITTYFLIVVKAINGCNS